MKRLLFFLILLLFFCFSCAAAAPWRVFDNVDLFTDEEIQNIEKAIVEFQHVTNNDFAVLTFEGNFGTNNSGDIATAFYESNNFGFGSRASGAVYFFHVIDDILYANFARSGEMSTISLDEYTNVCKQYVREGKYTDAIIFLIKGATTELQRTQAKPRP